MDLSGGREIYGIIKDQVEGLDIGVLGEKCSITVFCKPMNT